MSHTPCPKAKAPYNMKGKKSGQRVTNQFAENLWTGAEVPIKRPKIAENEQSCGIGGVDKFYRYVDKLEHLLTQSPLSTREASRMSEGILPKNLCIDSKLIITHLFDELNNAEKLSKKHLKIFEKYGIVHETLQRPDKKIAQSKPDPRSKFDEIEDLEFMNSLPKQSKSWNLDQGFSVKPLQKEFSIKKTMQNHPPQY